MVPRKEDCCILFSISMHETVLLLTLRTIKPVDVL